MRRTVDHRSPIEGVGNIPYSDSVVKSDSI